MTPAEPIRFLRMDELNRPEAETYRTMGKMPLTVILDNVRSGLNVGSIFRSCDSFLIEKIILCGITATPPDREVLKTALGATETVAWTYAETAATAVTELKNQSYRIFAAEQGSPSIRPDQLPDHPFPAAVLFGHEVKGVDPTLIPLLDGCIEIPQSGTKHSLNVAVAAGIILWEWFACWTQGK